METIRHKAIDTITSNLIMAEIVKPESVARFMVDLETLSDNELALAMVESRIQLNEHMETKAWFDRCYYTEKDTII